MNTSIEAYLKAEGRSDYRLELGFFDNEWLASITDAEAEPVYFAVGNTPTEALDKLAEQLGPFPGHASL